MSTNHIPTLTQHLSESASATRAEARQYAKAYGIPLAQALSEVRDEYAQGWHDAKSATRCGDWDYLQE